MKSIWLVICSVIWTNISLATDDLPTYLQKDEQLFLKTGNILNLKHPEQLDNLNRALHLNKEAKLNKILEKLNINKQVHPGTENPSIGNNGSEGRVSCDNNNCEQLTIKDHSVINDLGKKNINYSLEGFQSVGILIIKKTNETNVCNFVVISKEWLITARHCYETGPNTTNAWLMMRSINISDPSLTLRLDGCQSNNQSDLANCTYHKLKLSTNQPETLWGDNADLALLKLDSKSLPSDFPPDAFPTLDFSKSNYDIVTLVGNGKSNIENYRSRRPLVGWFKGKFTENSNMTFLEPSLTDTKPAPGDSGSPVYRGEYFGRKCELENDKCKPYLLSAFVSKGLSQSTVIDANDASKARTGVIRIYKYKEFICSRSKESKGCQ